VIVSETNEGTAGGPQKAWLDVSEAAKQLGVSPMSLYRAIADKRFPAVKIGTRIRIPAGALAAMADVALRTGSVVDTADWREVLMTG
jgi:excisionase family DNA binding protein